MEKELGWQELKIDDLPSDILVGDYEWQFSESLLWHYEEWNYEEGPAIEILEQMLEEDRIKYRYRKRQAKTASHEEIIKDVKDSAKFNEDGFRAVVIEALCFILESTPEAK